MITDLMNQMAHPGNPDADPERLVRDLNTQLQRLQTSRRVQRVELIDGNWHAHMVDGARERVTDLLNSAARPKTP